FFRRLAEGVFDVRDLHARSAELAEWIAAATEAYGLERGLVAAGFSNGANIAAGTLLEGRALFRAAILIRPMVPFVPEAPGEVGPVPVWIGAGRVDPVATPEHSEKLAELLRAAGASVTLHWESLGH